MSLSLTIGGVDFLPKYQNGSAKITANIQNQGDILDLTLVVKKGGTLPAIGAEIVFKDGSRFLFGGFISRLDPVEYGIGEMIEYKLEATDYTYLLINKTAQKNYAGMTLQAIVADLVTNNIDAGYAVTYANTATGPTIDTIAFNHITLRKCFENLAKLTNFIWWIDYQKDIHFIDTTRASVAPESVTDASANIETMSITLDISQVRNDIVILGGTQESSNYPQVILGDGNAREWFLLYPVQKMVSVELDTGGGYVAKTFGVDPADDETLYNFMYSPTRGSIRASSGTSTPGATHKIRVTFTYPLPVITDVQDAVSIAALKAIEGGDGVHTYTINDQTILSSAQAKQRALKELAQFSQPILSGNFLTRTGLLQAGSIFAPGQLLTVNLPSWGINTNTNYIIQKVMTTMVETGATVEYVYEVTFGGRLIGVVDFLLALGTPETPLDTSGEVQIIKGVSETVTVTEAVAKNAHNQTVAETVTVSESFVRTNVTPPFKWAPSGTKKAVWQKFEWG